MVGRSKPRPRLAPLLLALGVLLSACQLLTGASSLEIDPSYPGKAGAGSAGSSGNAGSAGNAAVLAAACSSSSDCESEHCQNGFCCESGDCCNVAEDCPASYAAAASCDDLTATTTCQGHRLAAVCSDNRCSSMEVEDDAGCEGGQRACPDHRAPVVCSQASDQPVAECTASCAEDGDCTSGYVCEQQACSIPTGTGNSCTSDLDCEAPLTCSNGLCCAGFTCCDDDADCSKGLTCDTETSTCLAGCVNFTTEHCSVEGEVCYRNECVPTFANGEFCVDDSLCTSGSCADGTCCNQACDSLCQSCLGHLTGLSNGTCALVNDGLTDGQRGQCSYDGVGCKADACACKQGSCLNANGQTCSNDADCASGHCSGKCVECASNQHCPGETCVGNLCVPVGPLYSDCDDDFDCSGSNVSCRPNFCDCKPGYSDCDKASPGCELCGACAEPCSEYAMCSDSKCLCPNDFDASGWGTTHCVQPKVCLKSGDNRFNGACL